MKITVTQDHIDRGKPRCYDSCPIALAIKETLGTEFVGVNDEWVDVIPPGGGAPRSIDTPAAVSRRIAKYDVDGTMDPFEFELEYTL